MTFLTNSLDFQPLPEDSPKIVRRPHECFWTFPKISDGNGRFMKITEDIWGRSEWFDYTPKIYLSTA